MPSVARIEHKVKSSARPAFAGRAVQQPLCKLVHIVGRCVRVRIVSPVVFIGPRIFGLGTLGLWWLLRHPTILAPSGTRCSHTKYESEMTHCHKSVGEMVVGLCRRSGGANNPRTMPPLPLAVRLPPKRIWIWLLIVVVIGLLQGLAINGPSLFRTYKTFRSIYKMEDARIALYQNTAIAYQPIASAIPSNATQSRIGPASADPHGVIWFVASWMMPGDDRWKARTFRFDPPNRSLETVDILGLESIFIMEWSDSGSVAAVSIVMNDQYGMRDIGTWVLDQTTMQLSPVIKPRRGESTVLTAISPTGKRVVSRYTYMNLSTWERDLKYESGIAMLDRPSGSTTRFANSDASPVLIANCFDGNRILVNTETGVGWQEIATSQIKMIWTRSSPDVWIRVLSISTRTGIMLVQHTIDGGNGLDNVHLGLLDPTSQRLLILPIDASTISTNPSQLPRWNPSGTHIFFTMSPDPTADPMPSEVWSYDLESQINERVSPVGRIASSVFFLPGDETPHCVLDSRELVRLGNDGPEVIFALPEIADPDVTDAGESDTPTGP